MNLGAVMPRRFVQYFSKTVLEQRLTKLEHSGHFYPRNRSALAIHSAVVIEGLKMYGHLPSGYGDDSLIIKSWQRSDESTMLDEEMLSIFKDGCYAPIRPFHHYYTRRAAGKHPRLISILQRNGYDFDEDDFNEV